MIPLIQDDIGPPFEQCCFCFKPTPFWYQPKDVACCPECGEVHEPAEVPSKVEWCRQVRSLESKGV